MHTYIQVFAAVLAVGAATTVPIHTNIHAYMHTHTQVFAAVLAVGAITTMSMNLETLNHSLKTFVYEPQEGQSEETLPLKAVTAKR